MGVQEHRTKVITGTLNPKWNHSMQFTIKNLDEDVLCITVYDRDLFSPNGECILFTANVSCAEIILRCCCFNYGHFSAHVGLSGPSDLQR